MNEKVVEIIDGLSAKQAIRLFEAASSKSSSQYDMEDLKNLAIGVNVSPDVAKDVLKMLATLKEENEVTTFLRNELIEHENYFIQERKMGPTRSLDISLLPYVVFFLMFIKSRISLTRKDRKMNLEFEFEFETPSLNLFLNQAIQKISSSNSSTNPNNFQREDAIQIIHEYLDEAKKNNVITNKNTKKKELESLLKNNKIDQVIEVLLELLESSNEEAYQEVLVISSTNKNLKKRNRLGTCSDEYFRIQRNKIAASLLEYMNEL